MSDFDPHSQGSLPSPAIMWKAGGVLLGPCVPFGIGANATWAEFVDGRWKELPPSRWPADAEPDWTDPKIWGHA
jgi:hypothetical protein